jgi:anti-sigma regulatory factor (Ser/Thr protein kinase)
MREKSKQIIAFILANVRNHPNDVTALTAKEFGISRPAALRYINRLIKSNVLAVEGNTKDRIYKPRPLIDKWFDYELNGNIREDKIWRTDIRPLFAEQSTLLQPNVLEICQYGITEMINNVIDHSESQAFSVGVTFFLDLITISILDKGIGIFRKIQRELDLDDLRHAILELSKGKLTTDPARHTGEGIFFTSRAFDSFSILSGSMFFGHTEKTNDWLLERKESTPGTSIFMEISPISQRILREVFDQYTSDEHFGFSKTHVPVFLAQYGDDNLVSRSQAKRLLARFDRFEEIVLDFDGVDQIGQAFADEIFRVFYNSHPNTHITFVRANKETEKMILHAIAAR